MSNMWSVWIIPLLTCLTTCQHVLVEDKCRTWSKNVNWNLSGDSDHGTAPSFEPLARLHFDLETLCLLHGRSGFFLCFGLAAYKVIDAVSLPTKTPPWQLASGFIDPFVKKVSERNPCQNGCLRESQVGMWKSAPQITSLRASRTAWSQCLATATSPRRKVTSCHCNPHVPTTFYDSFNHRERSALLLWLLILPE